MPRNKTQTSIVQSLLEERRFSCFHSDRKKMFLLQGATLTVLSDTLALRTMSPCLKGGGSLFCSIYSYQPLSPPPRSRSPPGNDSWRHTQDRSARHTPKKISNKDKRENWTSVLVKVMFGRQTVRKCGLSRPGGEKLLMFGSFGCFETHELVAFEFCCLLELTYCVLACVRQQLGH